MILSAADPIQIAGLPLHPLIVHLVVVLTPLVVLALLLGALWPAARRRLGIVTPLGALVVLVLVPITIAAGESLAEAVGPLPAVARHEALAGMLPPWAIGLFVVAAAQWVWFRFVRPRFLRARARSATVVDIALAVVAFAVGTGTVLTLVAIGDSGARAVWGGLLSG